MPLQQSPVDPDEALPPGASSRSRPALTLEQVSKVFGTGRSRVQALDRIDLAVDPGELVCVVGASGCGKSTLLNLLAGLDQPTAGEVSVSGRTGLMFQEAALFPWRAGRVLGARGLSAYRHIILPASLPSFVGGLKQGWAFAWRSLMAGELLVVIAGQASIGVLMQNSRSLRDMEGLMASMVVILVIGVVVDAAVFGTLDRTIRRRWGLVEGA